jgi:coenzyme Q-binding protein COQ10
MTAYRQHQHLKYTASQLFDLVADVERYPLFLPGIIEASVRHRKDHTILVDMTIAVGPFRKRFSTVGVLHRPHRIDISSGDSMFDRFAQWWTFESAASGGTNVEYHVDFQFRSRALQVLMAGSFANRAVATMAAFRHRADQLYGRQS